MRSLSKLVKSHRLILDNQTYQLAPQIVPLPHPFHPQAESEDGTEHDDSQHYEVGMSLEQMVAERMEAAEEEVRIRLLEAEQDREVILREAYEQAQAIREDARSEGYEAGRRAGFDEGRTIADALIQEALAVKEQILQKKVNTSRQIEEDAVQLILDTVELILGKHVQEDYDLVLGIIRMAMEKLTYTESLALRVSAEDYDMAFSKKDQILALAENVDDINIKPDKSLKPGSCIIDAASGSIDSGIWTQFEQIKESFKEMLASE